MDYLINMTTNDNMHKAKSVKNDEFYTQLEDIGKEIPNYGNAFNGKKVLCNCNDGEQSAFLQYFSNNYTALGLAKLTCISYCENGHGTKYTFGNENKITELQGNGDFRSEESIAELKDCDIVVTNPPFSLFREYMALLMEYDKQFLIIGNLNAINDNIVFPSIKANKIWIGVNCVRWFEQPTDTTKKCKLSDNGKPIAEGSRCYWYTNLDLKKRNEVLTLTKTYDGNNYPKFDNYDAIEVARTKDIPLDYDGVMGVPITFLDKYNPNQFEIVDAHDVALYEPQKRKKTFLIKDADGCINGVNRYARICIRHKR